MDTVEPAIAVDAASAPPAAVTLPSPPPVAPLPPIADGIERSLDPRSIKLGRIVGWISSGSISLGVLAAVAIVLLVSIPGWIKTVVVVGWIVLSLVLAWLAHSWPGIEHRHSSYKVEPEGIEIRKGVVWRKVIDVPRSRVQHTDVSQGPFERYYGLGTLVLYTAGTQHARVDLPGLDHATALRIRDHFLARKAGDADDAV